MKQFEITLPEDVARFFLWLVFDRRLNFHPDDGFEQYQSYETHEPTFTAEEVAYYNNRMELCFNVCEKYKRDIYEIAIRIFKLYHYCDCNDSLANIGEET